MNVGVIFAIASGTFDPAVLEIVVPDRLICPAVRSFVNRFDPPPVNLFSIYDLSAFCVGTMLFDDATKVFSVENSLIVACDPPKLIPPNLNSLNPVKSKKSALRVTPVSYTHLPLPPSDLV